jgi:hypothetical protein
LMQYHCLKRSVILSETRMWWTLVIPLRYLAATDTSGSVARQQKITHVHEHPFYTTLSLPTLLPCGRKYSRILFGQTMYLCNTKTANM